MFAWVKDHLRHKRFVIRLREPERFRLFTGRDQERIDATFDAGGRIISLIVHTRSRSLQNG